MRKLLAAAAVLGVGLYLAGHLPASVADQKSVQQQVNTSAATSIPAVALVPMVVNGSAFFRDVPDNIQQWSVYCIPADTEPFELRAAVHWREVEVSEQGPDGPDGYWKQHRPCPDGKILAGN